MPETNDNKVAIRNIKDQSIRVGWVCRTDKSGNTTVEFVSNLTFIEEKTFISMLAKKMSKKRSYRERMKRAKTKLHSEKFWRKIQG